MTVSRSFCLRRELLIHAKLAAALDMWTTTDGVTPLAEVKTTTAPSNLCQKIQFCVCLQVTLAILAQCFLSIFHKACEKLLCSQLALNNRSTTS